ncbi:MAG: ATP-binding cassette domain-containing protein, partial [Methylococcales bacterium]|nr:ATP-binding cassette domain-containing protein [Methylococcales bacterium]
MILKVKNLSIKYQNNVIFNDINLSVSDSDLVVIKTGVSDGSTSLLKALYGNTQYVSGSLHFNNNDVMSLSRKDINRIKSQIGFVYEQAGLISIYNILDNIILPLHYHALENKDNVEVVHQVAEDFNVQHLLMREPSELSDVEIRLINLVRAILMKPKLLLVDELGGGMSESFEKNIINKILAYQSQIGF